MDIQFYPGALNAVHFDRGKAFIALNLRYRPSERRRLIMPPSVARLLAIKVF